MPIEAPAEWTPALVVVHAPAEQWERVALARDDGPLPVYVQRVAGEVRILAEWPRSGPGRYRLRLRCGEDAEERVVTILPAKISPAAYELLLEDLEGRLPASVALALYPGGMAGLRFLPPAESTLAQEWTRLRRAVEGTPERPGLAAVLAELARDPHQVLTTQEIWVRRERARRPHPSRLAQALSRGENLDQSALPALVLDTRVEPTADVYENRLVRTFHDQVDLRLRRLIRLLRAGHDPELGVRAAALLGKLNVVRRAAGFLDGVRSLDHPPDRLTMVLLKRPAYRSALEGFLELHRSAVVRLETAALEAPLTNLPSLYQTWGTLQLLEALSRAALEQGYRLRSERLLGRDLGGVFVRILPDGQPAAIWEHPHHGTVVRIIPERSYRRSGDLRSLSFEQRPDVAVEIEAPGAPTRVYLFDPKYKLDGDTEASGSDGRPKKVDIDKMHAYRDAIRDAGGTPVVRFAAILYPGPDVTYGQEIAAYSAVPGREGHLEERLRILFRWVLSPELRGEVTESSTRAGGDFPGVPPAVSGAGALDPAAVDSSMLGHSPPL